MLNFSNATLEEMKRVEQVVAQAIVPFRNGRVEAMIVVFALVRVARQLFDQYPEKARRQLGPVLTAFLERKKAPAGVDPDDAASRMLWLPEDVTRRN